MAKINGFDVVAEESGLWNYTIVTTSGVASWQQYALGILNRLGGSAESAKIVQLDPNSGIVYFKSPYTADE